MNSGFFGWAMPPRTAESYINVQDQKAATTDGGTFTSGSYQTRVLTTIVSDRDGLASLASNQLTLPGGTYRTRIVCPADKVDRHKARLQDVTNAVTLVPGQNAVSSATDNTQTPAFIIGEFTILDAAKLEVQHRCQTTASTVGFGAAMSFSETEIYTVAEFWKIG